MDRVVAGPDLDLVTGLTQAVGAAEPDHPGPDDDDAHGPILPHRAPSGSGYLSMAKMCATCRHGSSRTKLNWPQS